MEAKELRIGNYVYSNKFVIKSYGVDGFINILKNIDNFTPIPLTEEWLVKFDVLFGFNHCGSYYSFELGLDGYDLRLNYGIGVSKYIGSCKYLHQLQNLYFALTNKELTIK